MASLTAVFLCLATLCIVKADRAQLNELLFNGDYEFIDLTHPFDSDTVYWPQTQNFVFTKKNEFYQKDGSWYASNEFAAGEHGGTHIDAPYHFTSRGLRVGDIPMEKLIVPLVVVDVASQVHDDPNFILYTHNLDYMLNNNLGKPCLLLFKFGWSKFFGNRTHYLGTSEDRNDQLNFPGLSEEVIEWITTSFKNVVGIAVDVASVDPGSSTTYPVHKTAAAAGLYNIENVNIDRPIPDYGCTALVMPMKIARGSGAPVRLTAICPKQLPKRQNYRG